MIININLALKVPVTAFSPSDNIVKINSENSENSEEKSEDAGPAVCVLAGAGAGLDRDQQ